MSLEGVDLLVKDVQRLRQMLLKKRPQRADNLFRMRIDFDELQSLVEIAGLCHDCPPGSFWLRAIRVERAPESICERIDARSNELQWVI